MVCDLHRMRTDVHAIRYVKATSMMTAWIKIDELYRQPPQPHMDKTSLTLLLEREYLHIVNSLIRYGANPNGKDRRGLSPMEYVGMTKNNGQLEAILANGKGHSRRE
jgi:hypothetical protein